MDVEAIQAEESTEMTFNGINMLKSKEYLDCRLGPNKDGKYVEIKMDVMDYEIMCK